MLKILLVEDNKGDQKLFKSILSESKLDVDLNLLDSAENITYYVQQTMPDVIFMDVMMSGITGGDAVKILRSNPSIDKLPIIFLTSLFDLGNNTPNQGINVDGVVYPSISKPITTESLLEALKTFKLI